MRNLHFFLILLYPIYFFGQDSLLVQTKPHKNKFYFSCEYAYNLYTSSLLVTKYADDSWAHIKGADFNFKIPAFGLGHIYTNHNLFVRNELSFWYGLKKVMYNENINQGSGPPSQRTGLYPSYYDYFNGYVDFLNIDWELSAGIGRKSLLGIFFGFKRNFVPYYSVGGELERTVVVNEYYYSYYPVAINSKYVEVYKGNEIKNVWRQEVYGTFYYNLGLSSNFEIKGNSYFAELTLSVPSPIFYNEFEMHFIRLKVAKYFKDKKKKFSK